MLKLKLHDLSDETLTKFIDDALSIISKRDYETKTTKHFKHVTNEVEYEFTEQGTTFKWQFFQVVKSSGYITLYEYNILSWDEYYVEKSITYSTVEDSVKMDPRTGREVFNTDAQVTTREQDLKDALLKLKLSDEK